MGVITAPSWFLMRMSKNGRFLKLCFMVNFILECGLCKSFMLWHYVDGPPSRRSLCLFWRETRQRVLDSRSRTRPEVGKGTREWERERERAGRRNSWEVSWRRETRSGQSTPEQKRQSAWERVQSQWGKISQDESGLLVVYRIFASVSLQGMQSVT